VIYNELFEYARDGLELAGLSSEDAHHYIRPLRERFDRRTTPARWKYDHVSEAVESGTPLTEAIWGMQSEYIEGSFADWLTE